MNKCFCRGPRAKEFLTPEALAKWEQDGNDPNDRVGCGADLTKAIEEVPEDGKDHQIQCPVCGNTSTVMRTPSS